MQPSTFEPLQDEEREMPRSQRELVNTCFEEAHYESGIQVLDRLRSPRYMPTMAHIRQLIYIALYPPAPSPNETRGTPVSPKMLFKQRQGQKTLPTREASDQALNLLIAFARTNSPASIMRAIPSYGDPNGTGSVRFEDDANDSVNRELGDSAIGKSAIASGHVKDCWGLLEPRVIVRQDYISDDSSAGDSDSDDDDQSSSRSKSVGKYSWGILEFLIEVFEEDEKRAVESVFSPVSLCILSQIPRVRSGQQWDVERPLNVVFTSILPHTKPNHPTTAAFDPFDARLGIRLLSLLVNATLPGVPAAKSDPDASSESSNPLSPTHLIKLTVSHLRSPRLLAPTLQFILDSLRPSHKPYEYQYDAFKLILLCELLGGSEDTNVPTSKLRNIKPRARTQAVSASSSASSVLPNHTVNPYPLPSLLNLFQHLSVKSPSLPAETAKHTLAKLHVLIYYDRLVSSTAREAWHDALRGGKVRQAVQSGFGHTTAGQRDRASVVVEEACMTVLKDLEDTGVQDTEMVSAD